MTPTLATTTFQTRTPIGVLEVTGTEQGIEKIEFLEGLPNVAHPQLTDNLSQCRVQLDEYFWHGRRAFEGLPMTVEGTDFERAVWKAVANIPYGQTRTYEDIAQEIGEPNAMRAVGTAVGKNPLCILIPCHRVVPKSGGVGEYAWGARRKEWLLKHEGAIG